MKLPPARTTTGVGATIQVLVPSNIWRVTLWVTVSLLKTRTSRTSRTTVLFDGAATTVTGVVPFVLTLVLPPWKVAADVSAHDVTTSAGRVVCASPRTTWRTLVVRSRIIGATMRAFGRALWCCSDRPTIPPGLVASPQRWSVLHR